MRVDLATPSDFSFAQCVTAHGWRALPPFHWDPPRLTRIEDFGAAGIVRLTIDQKDGFVSVELNGEAPEDEVTKRVARMLQMDVPVGEFHAYCASHPTLHQIPLAKQGRLLRSPTVFEDVVKIIATTNTTWAQTIAMVSRIVESFGSPLTSDPTLKSFPSPEKIAQVSPEEFAAKAKMGYRNASVHQIATQIAAGEFDLEAWNAPSITSEQLFRDLLTLPGVGPYAASSLMLYLGRYDRVNVDSWARTLVGGELGRKVTDKEVHQFFEPYGKWRALAYHFYPWRKDEPV